MGDEHPAYAPDGARPGLPFVFCVWWEVKSSALPHCKMPVPSIAVVVQSVCLYIDGKISAVLYDCSSI